MDLSEIMKNKNLKFGIYIPNKSKKALLEEGIKRLKTYLERFEDDTDDNDKTYQLVLELWEADDSTL